MSTINTVVKQRNGRGYSYNFELDEEAMAKHGNLYKNAKVSLYFDTGAKAKSDGGYERASGYRLAIRPYNYVLKDAGVSFYSSLSFLVRDGSRFGPTVLEKLADQLDFASIAKMYGNQNFTGICDTLESLEA